MGDYRGAVFVHCPGCGRWMLGQVLGKFTYPQPHECPKENPMSAPDTTETEALGRDACPLCGARDSTDTCATRSQRDHPARRYFRMGYDAASRDLATRDAAQRAEGIRIAAHLVRDHVTGATGKGIGAFLDERADRIAPETSGAEGGGTECPTSAVTAASHDSAPELALARVIEVVEMYESCGPKQQSTRDVLAALRAVIDQRGAQC